MTLADELKEITRRANRARKFLQDEAYLLWRKKFLTPDFYAKLKSVACRGEDNLEIECDETDQQHLKRWAVDHGLGFADKKIWWPVH